MEREWFVVDPAQSQNPEQLLAAIPVQSRCDSLWGFFHACPNDIDIGVKLELREILDESGEAFVTRATGQSHHDRSFAAMARDQAFVLETQECLAYGFAAHAELTAKVVLGRKTVTGCKCVGEPANQDIADLQVPRKWIEEV